MRCVGHKNELKNDYTNFTGFILATLKRRALTALTVILKTHNKFQMCLPNDIEFIKPGEFEYWLAQETDIRSLYMRGN